MIHGPQRSRVGMIGWAKMVSALLWEGITRMSKPDKPGSARGTGIGLGIALGVAFGLMIDNLALGIGVGVAIGVAIDEGLIRRG